MCCFGMAYKNHDKKPSEGLECGRVKKTEESEERTGRIFCPGDFCGEDMSDFTQILFLAPLVRVLMFSLPLYNIIQDVQGLHFIGYIHFVSNFIQFLFLQPVVAVLTSCKLFVFVFSLVTDFDPWSFLLLDKLL